MTVTIFRDDGDTEYNHEADGAFRWTECVIAFHGDGEKMLIPMDDIKEVTFQSGEVKTLGQVLSDDELSDFDAFDAATSSKITGIWME